jgi:hypothetical protein
MVIAFCSGIPCRVAQSKNLSAGEALLSRDELPVWGELPSDDVVALLDVAWPGEVLVLWASLS